MVSFVSPALQGLFPGTQDADSYVATEFGISRSIIDAEAGADLVFGLQTGDNQAGISDTLIDTDQDADRIAGIGTGVNTFGIAGGGIRTGSGDDVLLARGTLQGLQNASVDMGTGNDFMDIQDGIGLLSGGEGFDTLRLQGLEEDFEFTVLDPDVGTVSIIGVSSGTDLLVTLTELFQFETDTTFTEVTIQEILA